MSRCERPSVDGAHGSATPTVPCAQLTTGQPSAGGVPLGTKITPVTAVFSPARPVEVSRGRYASAVFGSHSSSGSGSTVISWPGPVGPSAVAGDGAVATPARRPATTSPVAMIDRQLRAYLMPSGVR